MLGGYSRASITEDGLFRRAFSPSVDQPLLETGNSGNSALLFACSICAVQSLYEVGRVRVREMFVSLTIRGTADGLHLQTEPHHCRRTHRRGGGMDLYRP